MAMLTYKGYSAVLEVDLEAGELFGRTVGMRDIITFQGKTIEEARRSFEESVDFYLECCREERKKPDRPYSGRFNVRITPELHRRLAILAESQGQSLNELVSATLSTVTGEVPIQPNVPEPTWQEVKAKLEARRSGPKKHRRVAHRSRSLASK